MRHVAAEIPSTHITLLSRLRDASDHAAWQEFEGRYRELLVRFCRRRHLQLADAEDVVQAVFAGLAGRMPEFVYAPERGRFSDYLFRCTRNALAKWFSRPENGNRRIVTGVDPDAPGESADADAAIWHDEWVNHHYRLALAFVRQDCEARSVAMFDQLIQGESMEEIANRFDTTVAAVQKVKQRIRGRMTERIALQMRDEEPE